MAYAMQACGAALLACDVSAALPSVMNRTCLINGLCFASSGTFGGEDLLLVRLTNNLLVSWVFLSPIRFAALILFRTGNFGVHRRVGRERILLKRLNGVFESWRIGSDLANCANGFKICTVGELYISIRGLDPVDLPVRDIPKCRPVRSSFWIDLRHTLPQLPTPY